MNIDTQNTKFAKDLLLLLVSEADGSKPITISPKVVLQKLGAVDPNISHDRLHESLLRLKKDGFIDANLSERPSWPVTIAVTVPEKY